MIDKNKIMIAGICLLVGVGIGFIISQFVNNLILLVAGFFAGMLTTIYLYNKKKEKNGKSH